MTRLHPRFRLTAAGCWSDAELLCIIAADALDDAATWFRRLGGRCYGRAKDAREARREGRA